MKNVVISLKVWFRVINVIAFRNHFSITRPETNLRIITTGLHSDYSEYFVINCFTWGTPMDKTNGPSPAWMLKLTTWWQKSNFNNPMGFWLFTIYFNFLCNKICRDLRKLAGKMSTLRPFKRSQNNCGLLKGCLNEENSLYNFPIIKILRVLSDVLKIKLFSAIQLIVV